jgi:EAL domain-containing protein (putative c-di-GMP-specific phosphodiesterase class I)
VAFEARFWQVAKAATTDAALWDWDLLSGEFFCSTRWRELTGFLDAATQPRLESWLERVHESDRPPLEAALRACARGSTEHLRHAHRIHGPEESELWVVAEAELIRNSFGEPGRLSGTLRRDESREAVVVNTVPPGVGTPLLERAHLIERIAADSARLRRGAVTAPAAVMLLEPVPPLRGDRSISHAAALLVRCTRLLDAVAYMGDGRFALLLERPGSARDLLALAARIQQQLRGRAAAPAAGGPAGEDPASESDCRIGIAINSILSASPLAVLHRAELALERCRAKDDATTLIFDDILQRRGAADLAMETELEQALLDEQLLLHYRAVTRPGSRTPLELHSRLRWHQPGGGCLESAEFMPAAERAGLLPRVSIQRLEMASAQAAAILEITGLAELLPIAVDAFGQEIIDAEYPLRLRAILEHAQLPPQALRIEVDGNLALSAPEKLEQALKALISIGVGVALNHFGDLPYRPTWIARMPLDRLVLDPAVLSSLGQERRSAAVVGALISLAHALGLQVLGSGIESPAQEEVLRGFGCDLIRGPRVTSLLDGAALLEVLRRHDSLHLNSEAAGAGIPV